MVNRKRVSQDFITCVHHGHSITLSVTLLFELSLTIRKFVLKTFVETLDVVEG